MGVNLTESLTIQTFRFIAAIANSSIKGIKLKYKGVKKHV